MTIPCPTSPWAIHVLACMESSTSIHPSYIYTPSWGDYAPHMPITRRETHSNTHGYISMYDLLPPLPHLTPTSVMCVREMSISPRSMFAWFPVSAFIHLSQWVRVIAFVFIAAMLLNIDKSNTRYTSHHIGHQMLHTLPFYFVQIGQHGKKIWPCAGAHVYILVCLVVYCSSIYSSHAAEYRPEHHSIFITPHHSPHAPYSTILFRANWSTW